jgi:uncharacterized surface protein with fasciclin (FAS1) repeats
MHKLILGLVAAIAMLGLSAVPASAAKAPTIGAAIGISADNGTFDTNPNDFDILREALRATKLDGLTTGKRQITVFAPQDKQFLALAAALPGGQANPTEGQALMEIAGALGLDTVGTVLAYHVAPGRRDAADVVASTRIRTLAKSSFAVSLPGGVPSVQGAGNDDPIAIAVPNAVLASNGIVHVINGILLP